MPADDTARASLASALLVDGQIEPSITQYEILLQQGFDNAMVLNNLAWLYERSGRPGAVELAERAVAQAPQNAQIIDTLGWILVRQGQKDRGIEYLQAAVELAPDSAEIRAHLDEALAQD